MTITTNIIKGEKLVCFTEREYRKIADCMIDNYAFCASKRDMTEIVLSGKFNAEFAEKELKDIHDRLEQLAIQNNIILRLLDGKPY